MTPALLIIDLQNDYLAAPDLQPTREEIRAAAGAWLLAFRQAKKPVIHVMTTVTREPDNRMPHWKAQDRWMCEKGTDGHAAVLGDPPGGEPMEGAFDDAVPSDEIETIVEKQFFSGFSNPRLHEALRERGCDTVILCGVHLHACVRATALDAYALGYRVFIAGDAVASDDPLHAAITRRYLGDRGMTFVTAGEWPALLAGDESGAARAGGVRPMAHRNPADRTEVLWEVAADAPAAIAAAAERLKAEWAGRGETPIEARAAVLRRLADLLERDEGTLADRICADVGKPITLARAEVRRSAALVRATADQAGVPLEVGTSAGARRRYCPLGLVAVITPWNNPLAIAAGKIAPAFLYDNAIAWKPAPAGTMVARRFAELCREAGMGLMHVIVGDQAAATALARCPQVDGITLTGGATAGFALQEIAARRQVPFQAELGGNNAAILADDYADIAGAAAQIAAAAFGFAGQRCTANRRVIVPRGKVEACWQAFGEAMRQIVWGDPREAATQAGPVISAARRRQLLDLLVRVRSVSLIRETRGSMRLIQRIHPLPPARGHEGNYAPLALVMCDLPGHEVVQEETFGPILVLQPADDFDDALRLANGVRQGLALALFSHDAARQGRFLKEARAGILKINQATAEADAVTPFGGWKSSGIGPAEHGLSDREFFTRTQALYGV